jgi:hypothetical protein
MRIAALREGQDHDTLLPTSAAFAAAVIIALTTALPPQRAEAQAGPPCTAIENDAERLACYDRALRTPSAPAPAPAAPAAAAPAPTAPAPTVPATPPTAPAQASAPPAAPADGDDDDRIVPIVIVGVRALPGREAIFTTEDGATWVQTDSQRVGNLPKTPFAAELKPGRMGSHFLVPKEHGRAIRVRNAAR